jgi:hypothetical protein
MESPGWRNWQTRQLEGLVGDSPMQVRLLSRAVFNLLFSTYDSACEDIATDFRQDSIPGYKREALLW